MALLYLLELALKRLERRNIIAFDVLPDKRFVRLLRTDFRFVGRKATQRKAVRSSKKSKDKKDYDGMMYQ
ncbi:MAG TPA: hypothetical protein EYP80_00020 [Candidatus Aenigmarchaeota archaeon]|nr:hypothetical protein [Candidatus Aenigmarchaeota archaeon]